MTPPKLHLCPKKLYVIEEPTKAFDFAMDELENHTVIGLSMQGKNLCRSGTCQFLTMKHYSYISSCDFGLGLSVLNQAQYLLKVGL